MSQVSEVEALRAENARLRETLRVGGGAGSVVDHARPPFQLGDGVARALVGPSSTDESPEADGSPGPDVEARARIELSNSEEALRRSAFDNAELRQLNEALAWARADAGEKEEMLRLTLDAAEIGTFDFDAATGDLLWDERCRALFGITTNRPLSYEDDFLDGLHPADRESTDAAVQEAVAPDGSGIFDVEYRTIGREDGVERWLAAKGSVVRRGTDRERFVGTVRDVTRRKQADAKLREAEERYRLVSRATNDAIWDWDLVQDHVTWNEALTTAFGHDLAEVVPIGRWRIDHIHPEDRDETADSLHAVIDGAGHRWSHAYRFLRRDGSYAAVQDRGYVLRDGDGRAIRMVGAMLDMSERQRAEDQQRLLMHELQHRVKNTLAMVQAIASQTFRASESQEAREAFANRVIALSQANEALTSVGWQAASMHEVVAGATSPHRASAERFTISGPALEIAAQAALALTLALHELCTNAAKYGALSNDEGRVSIGWDIVSDDTLQLRWAESGGPRVQRPTRTGFGTRLIERSLGPQFGGEVTTAFDPDGMTCTFKLPVSALQTVAARA